MRKALLLTALILLTAEGMNRLEERLLASGAPALYFQETGHNLSGPFLEYFQDHGGGGIFGYPITEEFQQGDRIVQFFEKVVLISPATRDSESVEIAPLGELLGARTPPISPSFFSQRYDFPYLYFPETGHTVAFAFREFFEEHGGVEAFGYPISEPYFENGRVVQYFQYARLEWHLENPPGEKVQLGYLGEEYFAALGLDPALTTTAQPLPQAQSATVATAQ